MVVVMVVVMEKGDAMGKMMEKGDAMGEMKELQEVEEVAMEKKVAMIYSTVF